MTLHSTAETFPVLITIYLENSCFSLIVFIYFMCHDHWLRDLVDSHLSSNIFSQTPAVSSVFFHLAKEPTSLHHGQAPSFTCPKFTTPVTCHYPSFSADQISVKLAHNDNLIMGFHINPAQGQCQMISFWYK